MARRGFPSIIRVATGVAIVAAVAGQLQYLADADLLRTVNFFSFFTIQSNILACLVLLGLDADPTTPLGRFARGARGVATLAMTMTGIIYAVLLAPIAADVSTQLDWVNLVVHVVAPIVVLVDWLVAPPTTSSRAVLGWLAFPVAWIAYTIVRGLVADWYPYPFIDPRPEVANAAGSWGAVVVTIAILTVAVVGLAFALRWIAAASPFSPDRLEAAPV